MSGLLERARGASTAEADAARRRWEAAMLGGIERLRRELEGADPLEIARRVGGTWEEGRVRLAFWGRSVSVLWESVVPVDEQGAPLETFEAAMLLHHLRRSDGSPLAGRWISFGDLPDGAFYQQAYRGYTGARLSAAFGADPRRFDAACLAAGGARQSGPAPHTWAFTPLPRVAVAACLWPGDDELPAQASVVFDANAAHHLPTDALALLGAGLTGRLLRAAP